jgi:hypothetical protein
VTRPYPFTVDPPRPVLDPASTNRRSKQECKACVTQDPESFHRLILYVTMVSRDGRPFSGHVTTTTSTAFDKTSPQRHPGVPASSYPIKGQAGDSTRGKKDGRKKTSHLPTIEDQHIKQSPLYSHFFSETWDRFPLSQLVTPTQTLRCKEIQYSLSPLDVGPSFARTRINLRVLSLHHHPD